MALAALCRFCPAFTSSSLPVTRFYSTRIFFESSGKIRDGIEAFRGQFPGHFLLVQMGGFYEIMGRDVTRLGEELVPLRVSRNGIAGFPLDAIDNWLPLLNQKFRRIAIIDESPASTGQKRKNRVVSRVISPGARVPELPAAQCNLVALSPGQDGRIGMSKIDVASGLASTSVVTLPDLIDHVTLAQPDELLIPIDTTISQPFYADANAVAMGLSEVNPGWAETLAPLDKGLVTAVPLGWSSSYENQSIPLDPDMTSEEACAFGMVARFLERAYGQLPGTLQLQQAVDTTHRPLAMNFSTRHSLELTSAKQERLSGRKGKSLLDFLNHTTTFIGRKELAERIEAPLTNPKLIETRYDKVEAMLTNLHKATELQQALKAVADPRVKIAQAARRPSVVESCLEQTAEAYGKMLKALDILQAYRSTNECFQQWQEQGQSFTEALPNDLVQAFLDADYQLLDPDDRIPAGMCEAVDKARATLEGVHANVADIEADIRSLVGSNQTLTMGWDEFGYFVRISGIGSQSVKAKAGVIQRTIGAEAKKVKGQSTPELEEASVARVHASTALADAQAAYYAQLFTHVEANVSLLNDVLAWIADLDVTASLAQAAQTHSLVRPTIDSEPILDIVQGRHPIVEAQLGQMTFEANSCQLSESGMHIITGPNMGGKSTYLRQVALAVIMAQMGSFVPAKSMHYGVVDKIFTRIGADDSIGEGMSTFMVEMQDVQQLLEHSTPRSLVVLDEVGRGTSPKDGLALALAILKTLHEDTKCRSVIVTHYHVIQQLCQHWPRAAMKHMKCQLDGGQVYYDHRLYDGLSTESYGVEMATEMLPAATITHARELRRVLEELDYFELSPQGANAVKKLL
eukprot:TRINITY_DN10727_c0_g1_i3.p1 TRINITY_DN10727_c0_g1~~TRINITY_DN10727_c0_g1_i3.p1  ORF type:complete len:858 (+),score=186.73 TRINITY_DN10727_c0_g1_i3:64-2637(+)